MELNRARAITESIKKDIAPFCHRIEVAGSIRRGKADVHDIDIVVIPISQAFYSALGRTGKVSGGPKIYRVEVKEGGRPVIIAGKPFTADIYIATEATWATLLLIRTGSKEHNIRLCTRAAKMGMKLHADGSGLERAAQVPDLFSMSPADCHDAEYFKILCPTEVAIFEALGLPYKSPAERE
jgi:DNA polymerase/3'-5' exonuclease PolX